MGTFLWREIGWLRRNKEGKDIAFCNECNKIVEVNYRNNGEEDSFICDLCGEECLGD